MLIEGADAVLVVLAATSPVALLVGVFVATHTNAMIAEANVELAMDRRRRELEEGCRELITWLSHELRTPLADANGVEVTGELAGSSFDVAGDAALLARAMQKFVVNAIQYPTPGSLVHVTTSAERDGVRVRVADGCGGLAADERSHMFDAGWRGDPARTPSAATSSGPGLPIVSTIGRRTRAD